MGKVWISLLLLISNAPIAAIGASNDLYRPYSHPFPQIIQANDYPTIEAIETFVDEMKGTGSSVVSCTAAESIITQHHYTTESTVILISTLKRLLDDLSLTHTCEGVGFAEFQTRAYKQRSVIEFNFGQTVLIIHSFSNGPDNGERLYVLDVVDREESFWRAPFFESLPTDESTQQDASKPGASD